MTIKEESIYEEAVKMVRAEKECSITLLRVKLNISYNAAASIIDKLEDNKIISSFKGEEPREVLV